MPLPGSPANALPADDAALMRRIEGIERQLRELGPSVASSIFPMIADLQAQADATDAVVAAMADVIAAQVSYEVAATSTASAWTVSTGMVTKASTTITVPAGYTQALSALVFELRRENQRLEGEAKVMRDLLNLAVQPLETLLPEADHPAGEYESLSSLICQINSALRGST